MQGKALRSDRHAITLLAVRITAAGKYLYHIITTRGTNSLSLNAPNQDIHAHSSPQYKARSSCDCFSHLSRCTNATNIRFSALSTKKLVKNAYNQTMTHHTFLETDGIQPFSPDVKKTVSFHRNKQQATKRTCLECTIFNIFSAVSLQRTVRVVPIVIATIETMHSVQ